MYQGFSDGVSDCAEEHCRLIFAAPQGQGFGRVGVSEEKQGAPPSAWFWRWVGLSLRPRSDTYRIGHERNKFPCCP
jgi:hypothetical protein